TTPRLATWIPTTRRVTPSPATFWISTVTEPLTATITPRETRAESMPTPLFVGCAVALVTPFGADGVDEACLSDLIRFHLQERTDALVVNGSTGEAATMSPAEQRRVAELA